MLAHGQVPLRQTRLAPPEELTLDQKGIWFQVTLNVPEFHITGEQMHMLIRYVVVIDQLRQLMVWEQKQLKENGPEGLYLVNDNGSMVEHPFCGRVRSLSREAQNLASFLKLYPKAPMVHEQRKQARDDAWIAADQVAKRKGDDLLFND